MKAGQLKEDMERTEAVQGRDIVEAPVDTESIGGIEGSEGTGGTEEPQELGLVLESGLEVD